MIWQQADPLFGVATITIGDGCPVSALIIHGNNAGEEGLAVTPTVYLRDSASPREFIDLSAALASIRERPAVITLRSVSTKLTETQERLLCHICTCVAVVHFERAKTFERKTLSYCKTLGIPALNGSPFQHLAN